MEFLNYKGIKGKLKKRGLLFKKPSVEEASNQFYTLARQLDDHKLYAGFCHLAISKCQGKSAGQVGAILNAARAFSKANHEIITLDDHIRTVIWIYSGALLICDRSFIKPITLEMGRFYESHKMYQQAAECFKQSMSISRCVNNLILAKRYENALDELKNCPSHLMTTKDQTSMFLLELWLNGDAAEVGRSSLQHLSLNSKTTTTHGQLSIDDHLFDLNGLLESLLIFKQDKKNSATGKKLRRTKVQESIADKLSAFLDPAQIQLLYLITSSAD